MKILVTGGCGFIGSNFINVYLCNHPSHTIVNIDRLDYCAKETNVSEHPMYTFVKGDINDRLLLLKILDEHHINVVIHFAAQSHVDNSFGNSLDFTRDNILGTHTLLESCREYGKVLRFIHMSTDEVYGEVSIEHLGCTEKSILNPTNPYAATKAGAEMIVRSYYHSFDMPVIITRCNNVYGPNQYPEKLIPKFIGMIKRGEKCTVHGNGQTRRNFIHSNDVALAMDKILTNGKIGKIYNIGTSDEFSVIEITKKILEYVRPGELIDDWIEFVDNRCYNDFRYSVDSSQLHNIGWKSTVDFEDGLLSLIRSDTYASPKPSF